MLFDVLRAGSAGAEVFFCARGGGIEKKKKVRILHKARSRKKRSSIKIQIVK
jgi:hypothetical protein